MDTRKPKRKTKRLDLKSLLLGTSKETTVPGSRFPNGTQSLVPVVDIRQGVLITEDGRYIKVLEILPTNFYLKSRVEQQNILYYLSSYLKIAPPSLQILVTTQRADIDAYCAQMEQYYNAETSEACKEMIVEDVQLVDYLAATEIVTRRFYLIFAYTGTASELDDIARGACRARRKPRINISTTAAWKSCGTTGTMSSCSKPCTRRSTSRRPARWILPRCFPRSGRSAEYPTFQRTS